MRHRATVKFLLEVHIVEIFGEERRGIHIKAGGTTENLCITGPTHPLIPLRAIGGNIQEVALLAPERVMNQLVYLLVGGLEITGALQLGMQHIGGKVFRLYLLGRDNIEIAKTVEGEMRPHMRRLSGRNKGVLLLGAAQIIPVEEADTRSRVHRTAPPVFPRREDHSLSPSIR